MKAHVITTENHDTVVVNQSAHRSDLVMLKIVGKNPTVEIRTYLTSVQAIQLATALTECHTAALKAEIQTMKEELKR